MSLKFGGGALHLAYTLVITVLLHRDQQYMYLANGLLGNGVQQISAQLTMLSSLSKSASALIGGRGVKCDVR